MKRAAGLAAMLALAAGGASAQGWPVAADIPKPAPVALGLAGEGVDITRYLLVRGASAFDLSADGQTVFYTTNVTGDPQLWSAPAAGGWPTQLTFGSGIDSMLALPDGGVVYGADTGGDERQGFYVLSPDGRRERVLIAKSEAFREIGDVSHDGRVVYASTERNGRDFDIYVADLATGASKRVYEGSFGFLPRAWQPGGPHVVVTEVRGEDGADLHLLNVDTGKMELLFRPKQAANFDGFEWLPDGSGFFLVSNLDREFQNLAFYDLKTRKIRFLEAESHDATNVSLSGDGRYLAWVSEVEGYSRLSVLDRQTNRKVDAPALPRGVYDMRFAEHAPVLGVRVTGAQAAGEVFTWNVATGALSRPVATSWAGLDPATMVTPEAITFKARDGVTVRGLFYAPKASPGGGKPPLVLHVHGGPSAHAVPGFSPHLQYFAARGMAVLDLNYRGSTGYGKTYAHLNDKRLRVKELGDLADAVAYMRSTGRVDPAKAAVMGGSYGGYLTNAALGAYPDLFVAGASFVGVSDWVKALEGASPALKASDRQEYGDIDDPKDRAFFASISPINNAGKIRTPLLVEHGANDPRDPVTESDRFVEAVRKAGTEVVYLRFPDEGHSVVNLANRVHMWRRVAAFLEEKFGMARP
ncbi:S9 family peptidase [Phenylobacterium sp.]|jgi:dipeptidyl aminopeptidase/acylaminoacyl peptidase|uniref:S9 family peptidase n=1 Tax=Phenylobacterium sp. TaxID=1871053 RepID=UPI002F937027